MSNVDIVKQCYAAVERGDRDTLNEVLSDDFVWLGAADEPINKQQIIDQALRLREGVPDIRFNLANLKEGEQVRGTLQLTGTHTDSLHIPPFTESPVEPTNRKIQLPEEPTTWTVRNDQIVRQETKAVEGGGPVGLLRQLGVPVTKTH